LQCGKTRVRAKSSFSSKILSDILFNGNFRTFILIDDMEPLWKLTCHLLTGKLILPEGTIGSFMYWDSDSKLSKSLTFHL
jgi:hypothetical protein